MPLTATSPEVMATVVLASTLRRRIVSWSSGLFTLSLGYLGLPLAELAALCAPLVAITALSCNGCALRVTAVHPVVTATLFYGSNELVKTNWLYSTGKQLWPSYPSSAPGRFLPSTRKLSPTSARLRAYVTCKQRLD
jgi:hypothetical protein